MRNVVDEVSNFGFVNDKEIVRNFNEAKKNECFLFFILTIKIATICN